MAFLVSPGVQVNEVDLTNVVPAVSTSIGGYAGAFEWGPINEYVTVGFEKDLVTNFGTPTATTAESFFTAASFLKYGTALKVVRAATLSGGSTVLNSTTSHLGTSGILIANRAAYEGLSLGTNTVGEFAAKWAGAYGNSLTLSVCPASSAAFSAWAYKSLFTAAPSTSDYAASTGSSKDELHIVVVDANGLFTGTPGTVLETFSFVSQAPDALTNDGTSNYYVNVLATASKYIWWLAHPATLTNAGTASTTLAGAYTTGTTALSYTFTGGANLTPATGDVQTALNVLADAETVDVNLLFAIPDGASVIAGQLISIAEARRDLVAFLSPPISATVNNATPNSSVMTWANAITSSSYAVMDSTALKVYNKYNDTYIWIPACGHIAGLCAHTDNVSDAWFSPAGYNRGNLLGVTKLAYNPAQADRDTLYKGRVNPIVSFPGQGILLYGDKTAQAKPSAFDRINVRRLFIVLEKAIATAAKYQLFEFNDQFTQSMFRNMTEPFLRDVQGRRGITAFKVICDSTNNTPQIVDSNQFKADIYIQPARSINFITLNFIATRTGVSFTELVGTNAG